MWMSNVQSPGPIGRFLKPPAFSPAKHPNLFGEVNYKSEYLTHQLKYDTISINTPDSLARISYFFWNLLKGFKPVQWISSEHFSNPAKGNTADLFWSHDTLMVRAVPPVHVWRACTIQCDHCCLGEFNQRCEDFRLTPELLSKLTAT